MILYSSKHRRFSRIVLPVGLLTLFSPSRGLAQEKEPIAYIGHGAFFDFKGNQIPLTSEFVAKAQAWYRTHLLSKLNAKKKAEFAGFEERWAVGVKAEGQARLMVENHSLQWLFANSPQQKESARMLGKLRALRYAMKWKLPERAGLEQVKIREEFKLDAELERNLQPIRFTFRDDKDVLFATANSGQAYIDECNNAGVPIPPPVGELDPAGLAGWKSEGFIPPGDQFIVGTPAEVRTFYDPAKGMCIALPRYSDETLRTVLLDGVICLGQTTSTVCFWDNQMMQGGVVDDFAFDSGDKIPIGVPDLAVDPKGRYQGGGLEIEFGPGGVCTDCHAGQNPYIVHPRSDLGGGVLMGDLALNLPTFSANRYNPLVGPSWPQNQLSHSPTLVPSVCRGCHTSSGSAGAFPHLSSELNGQSGYCNSVLRNAVARTMPPGAGGSQATNPDVIAFLDWCDEPASSGPSNRGDPHLTTTNNINYDFQAAGEFTALRNSSTGFELQNRQTPVQTTFIPGANPYTGLASCVSLNTAVAVRVGKYRVTYQPDSGGSAERLQLRINGSPVTLPSEGVTLGDGNRITRADSSGGLDVKLADGTRLIISQNFWSSQGYWYLNIEILNTPAREGTMGHIRASDWLPLAPDGSSFGPAPASLSDRHVLLNEKFADAWRVTKRTSLFDYAPGTSTDDYTYCDWPPKSGEPCECEAVDNGRPPSEPISPEEAKRLCRDVEDKAAYAECVFDVTATGDAGMAKAYLRTLQLRANAQP